MEELFRNEAEREVTRVLDLHEEMPAVARRKAEKEGLMIEFIPGNALEINFEGEFDAVTMFFSSITYFNDSSIQELFNSVKRVLKQGGVFIADFPCWFYGGSSPVVWDETKGDERLIITDWREVEPVFQKLHFKRMVQIIKPDGSVRAFMVDDELNVYTPREMRLLAEKHFRKVKIYGNLHELKPQRQEVLAGGEVAQNFLNLRFVPIPWWCLSSIVTLILPFESHTFRASRLVPTSAPPALLRFLKALSEGNPSLENRKGDAHAS